MNNSYVEVTLNALECVLKYHRIYMWDKKSPEYTLCFCWDGSTHWEIRIEDTKYLEEDYPVVVATTVNFLEDEIEDMATEWFESIYNYISELFEVQKELLH